MRKIALLTGILAMAAAFAVPVVYRNPMDARSWAVAFDRSPPLAWHWADGAVSAARSFDGTEFWTCDLLLENLGTAFIVR